MESSRFRPGRIGPAFNEQQEKPTRSAGSDPFGSEPEEHMLEIELAQRWRMSVRSLQRWRRARRGPPHLRIGQRVLYLRQDVEAYEARHRDAGDAP